MAHLMREGWSRRIGDRLVRRPRQRELEPVRVRVQPRRRILLHRPVGVLIVLAGGFAFLIGVGTLLLSLPFASVDGGFTPFRVALFTATSATCVTGLVVENTSTYWTGFGQAVTAALMYMGGLGIMTAGAVLLVAIGRRITLGDRLLMRESLGVTSIGSVTRVVRLVVLLATAIQLVGFLVLFFRFLALFPVGEAAWQALYHAISGFNNAGFIILPDSASLLAYQKDHLVLATLGILIVLGSLSFSVIVEMTRHRRFSRWSLDTRLVVLGTLFLWLLGGISMFVFELGNQDTLGALSVGDRVGSALFQSVASRTSGFSSIDFSTTHSASNFLFMVIMFIGGASASTAGGIKINTAMVLVVAAVASVRGRSRAEAFHRELIYPQVARALAVVLLAVTVLFGLIIGIMFLERASLASGAFQASDLLFEVVSGFGTVGLSTGITGDLSQPGQYLLALGMYVGRLGPLTIALGLALRERRAVYRFAEEGVRIG
jgi:trk system potassium uptake protein TrkH